MHRRVEQSGFVAGAPAQGRRRRSIWPRLAPYLFMAPFFALFVVFLVVPLGYALQLSLFKETMIGGLRFVWFDNYAKAFADQKFWEGIVMLFRYGLMQIPVMLGGALLMALILDSGVIWARNFIRLGLFMPYAVPTVIAALIWGYLYGPAFGPLTQLANYFGLPPPDLLSRDNLLASIANISVWEHMGYFMIIYFAALQSIPDELEEAAAVAGAQAWQYVIYVKLPLIRGTIAVTAIFAIIGTLQLFSEPYLVRNMAPSLINANYTPNIYAYNLAFTNQEYNYSAAISFMLGGVVAVISYLFMLATSRQGAR
jgi:multiple sugar transport system permease protein